MSNRRKGGRGGAGPRVRPRNSFGSQYEKIQNEGIYANPRIVHSGTSIIGCKVQVEVKNGALYEGLMKTFSPQLEIVLELAHKVEKGSNSAPSRDRLIEAVIFKIQDVVMINALDVDLDYACKDNFIDAAISSKQNGPVIEKQLQPWEDSGSGSGLLLDSLDKTDSSNGWDPNEMFQKNEELFKITSSYDPNLAQYTTQLKVEDTKEYREREAHAARMAREIEKSDAYRKATALENGDDQDEESKYSAVHRPDDNVLRRSEDSTGKYVPPHRKGVRSNSRTNSLSSTGPGRDSPTSINTSNSANVVSTSSCSSPLSQKETNGEKSESVEKSQPAAESGGGLADKAESKQPDKLESTKVHTTGAAEDNRIKELKDFRDNFVLEAMNKDKSPGPSLQEAPTPPTKGDPVLSSPTIPSAQQSPSQAMSDAARTESNKEAKNDPSEKSEDILKKSSLNPNAKVFNPLAKPFTPKQQQPVPAPTPPTRPQTQQSPNLMPNPGLVGPPYFAAAPTPHTSYIIQHQQPTQGAPNQGSIRPKKAVVSVQQTNNVHGGMGQPIIQPQGAFSFMPLHPSMPASMLRPVNQPNQLEQMQQQTGQPAAVFMSPMMPNHPGQHQSTPPHTQPSHMNSQATPGHPAPSPVQQQPPHILGHQGHQGHPPTAVTPQHQMVFPHNPQQMPVQPSHPSLQPSPHTPTSPIYQNTSISYPSSQAYPNFGQHQQQGGLQPQQAPQQLQGAHQQPQHQPQPHQQSNQHQQPQQHIAAPAQPGGPLTTVTHAQHQQHQHVPHVPPPPQGHHSGPQIVMMQGHQVAGNMAHAGGPHAQPLHFHQGMPGHLPGQAGPPLMAQPAMVSTANVHPNMQYVQPPMTHQGHPGPSQVPFHNNQ